MKFALLLYADMSQAPQYSPEDRAAAQQSWFTLLDEMKAARVYIENYGFTPVAQARTMRVRNGKAATTDGPSVVTTDTLGGYFLLDCKDINEALGWAAKIPYANYGSVEVRPIIAFTEDMAKKTASENAYHNATS